MNINQIIEQARGTAQSTDNHINYEIDSVVSNMTVSELIETANAENHWLFSGAAKKLETGSGTDFQMKRAEGELRNAIIRAACNRAR